MNKYYIIQKITNKEKIVYDQDSKGGWTPDKNLAYKYIIQPNILTREGRIKDKYSIVEISNEQTRL